MVETSVLEPAENEGVKVDDLVPEAVEVVVDAVSELLEGVKKWPRPVIGPACQRVEQQADVRWRRLGAPGDERPEFGASQISLELIPLCRDLLCAVGTLAVSPATREHQRLDQLSVSEGDASDVQPREEC